MIVFLIIAAIMTGGSYTSGKYYKSCVENEFKGEQCKAAKRLSKFKR